MTETTSRSHQIGGLGLMEAQAALKAAFTKGLDLRRFDLREPTLHDAFIVLTGGEA